METKMETLTSKNGELTWNILLKEAKPTKNRSRSRAHFTAVCSKCGYEVKGEKGNIQRNSKCPGCSPKPAALKIDDNGICITICRLGQLEYIHNLITEEGMTERDASKSFIETVKAHAPTGDPLTENLTIEKIRSQFRRDSGKLKDKPKVATETLVGSTQNKDKPKINGEPPQNKENSKPAQKPKTDLHVVERSALSMATRMAEIAITQLQRIDKDDPERLETLQRVIEWCENQKADNPQVEMEI